MKFANKMLVLVGCFVLSFLLSYAQALVLHDALTDENAASLNLERRTARIGKAATIILIINAPDRTIGNGSGFFVRPDLIVTNVHVLAGIHGKSYTWEVKSVNQPTQYTIKGVVASDPEHDLVILKVEGKKAEVLELADSDTVKLDERVIAVGTHESTHKNALGKSAYDAAIRLKPDFADAYAKRASAKYSLGDYKASIKDYDTAIRMGLDYAAAYVNRGVTKRSLRDYKGAIQDYNTAIRLDPENVEAYLNRGNAKSDLGDYEMAIEDCAAALLLDPGLAEVYKTRGEARSNLGNHNGATKDYDAAVSLKPDDAEVYYKRGCAKVEIGSVSEAKADLRAALKLARWESDQALKADIEEKLRLLK